MVFHCQQAAEKALKAFLTWHSRPFRRTHDLADLVRQCRQIEEWFSSQMGTADLLSPYAVSHRYPSEIRDPSLAQAKAALRLAHEIVALVVVRLP